MHNFFLFVFFIFSTIFLSNCASVFGDDNRVIHVSSMPSSAMVYYNGNEVGITPTDVVVSSTFSPGTITVKKEGYHTTSKQIKSSFQGIGILNIFFWPGFIIDVLTGKMMKINSGHFNVPLAKQNKELI